MSAITISGPVSVTFFRPRWSRFVDFDLTIASETEGRLSGVGEVFVFRGVGLAFDGALPVQGVITEISATFGDETTTTWTGIDLPAADVGAAALTETEEDDLAAILQALRNRDTVLGGAGADDLLGGAGADLLRGRGGDDELRGGPGADTLDGGPGFDIAEYGAAAAAVTVRLDLGRGVAGEARGDVLLSVAGAFGSDFDDRLIGDRLANRLNGAEGADTLRGGAGEDTLRGDAGADEIAGGAGYDYASYFLAASGVVAGLDGRRGRGEAVGDRLTGIEGLLGSRDHGDRLFGDRGDNVIAGFGGADSLVGAAGDDDLEGGPGADTLDGGAGADFAVYGRAAAAVRVNLATGVVRGGDEGDRGDRLVSIERVQGSDFDDTLTGDGRDNTFWGNDGDDVIRGAAGFDYIDGRFGADVMTGGAGRDTYDYDVVEDSPADAPDRITDFRPVDDSFDFSFFDGNATLAGRQAPRFIGRAAFSGDAAELRFANGRLSADVDGDRAADLVVLLPGVTALAGIDFFFG